jgi:hypothetical protein
MKAAYLIYLLIAGGLFGVIAIVLLAVGASTPNTSAAPRAGSRPDPAPARPRPAPFGAPTSIPGANRANDRHRDRRRLDEIRRNEAALADEGRRRDARALQEAQERAEEDRRRRIQAEDDARTARIALEAELRRREYEEDERRRAEDNT